MITQTSNPVTRGRFVDPDELICPGCGEQVRCAPPAAQLWDGEDETPTLTMRPQFSHRDSTPLCPAADGRAVEPIEQVGAG